VNRLQQWYLAFSFLWQHRTIPALRLKHRSGGCGTASALPNLRFWLSSCRTSLAVSALRIMRYCLREIPTGLSIAGLIIVLIALAMLVLSDKKQDVVEE